MMARLFDSLCKGWSKKFALAAVSCYGIVIQGAKVFEQDELFLDILDTFMWKS